MDAPQPSLVPQINDIAKFITGGELSQGLAMTAAFLQSHPANPEVWYLKGVIQSKLGDKESAITSFTEALKYKADYKEACHDLARALEETKQVMLAITTYERLLKIEQNSAEKKTPPKLSASSAKILHEWFYAALEEYKRGNLEKGIALSRKALAINPYMPEALANLGLMLYTLRRFEEAEKTLIKALHARNNYAEALNLLGNVFKETGRPYFALAAYRVSLAAKPTFRHASINIGKVFYELQNYPESIKAYGHTLSLDPTYVETLTELTHMNHLLCQWDTVDDLKARTVAALKTSDQCAEPFIFAVYGPLDLQLDNARRWAHKLFPGGKPYNPNQKLPAVARSDNKLRIGYVSSDYHRHATASLITEMFETHDRSRFDIFAYSYGVDDRGPERARIMGAVDRFVDLRGIDDNHAYDIMIQDQLDILVDLKGYTQGHRLGLLTRRPAPVQMHYLGHPGTTGAPFVDYFIADPVSAPPAIDKEFSERMIRLPYTYQINDRTRPLPTSALPREAYGLPAEGFVFCDFNNPYKITPEMFAVWMRLMKSVEGSVLWLYESHEEATQNLKREMEKHGIDPARLVIARPAGLADHFARYIHVDLVLDTSPVCGHTTTSDVLWCAVPLVTLMGDSFISRVAGSLLHAVGLPELAVNDLEAYEALALALIQDPARRQKIKQHLTEGRYRFPLFDTIATTRALEASYIQAAKLHREGIVPKAFSLAPDLSIKD